MSGSVGVCGSLFLRDNWNGGRKPLSHQGLLSFLPMMVNGVEWHPRPARGAPAGSRGPAPSNNTVITSALVPTLRVGMPSWPLRGPPPPHEDSRRRASKAAFGRGGWERARRAWSDGSRAYRRLRGSVRFGGVCRAKAPCLPEKGRRGRARTDRRNPSCDEGGPAVGRSEPRPWVGRGGTSCRDRTNSGRDRTNSGRDRTNSGRDRTNSSALRPGFATLPTDQRAPPGEAGEPAPRFRRKAGQRGCNSGSYLRGDRERAERSGRLSPAPTRTGL
jgi:hypothetical protein